MSMPEGPFNRACADKFADQCFAWLIKKSPIDPTTPGASGTLESR
jgi:hypothetical protein